MLINNNTKKEIIEAINGCKTNTTFQKIKATEGLNSMTNN